jgi:hypothetical protein
LYRLILTDALRKIPWGRTVTQTQLIIMPTSAVLAALFSGGYRMLFVIISEDIADSSPLRATARPDHLKRLNALRDAGRLIIAGPCPAIESDEPGPAGFTGSVVIAEFDDLEQARNWADDDPYVAAGAYQSVTVKPFKLVLP